jgi:hypothetical protein
MNGSRHDNVLPLAMSCVESNNNVKRQSTRGPVGRYGPIWSVVMATAFFSFLAPVALFADQESDEPSLAAVIHVASLWWSITITYTSEPMNGQIGRRRHRAQTQTVPTGGLSMPSQSFSFSFSSSSFLRNRNCRRTRLLSTPRKVTLTAASTSARFGRTNRRAQLSSIQYGLVVIVDYGWTGPSAVNDQQHKRVLKSDTA